MAVLLTYRCVCQNAWAVQRDELESAQCDACGYHPVFPDSEESVGENFIAGDGVGGGDGFDDQTHDDEGRGLSNVFRSGHDEYASEAHFGSDGEPGNFYAGVDPAQS